MCGPTSENDARTTSKHSAGPSRDRRRVESTMMPSMVGQLMSYADVQYRQQELMREFAEARGATVEYAGLTFPELRLDRDEVPRAREGVLAQREALAAGRPLVVQRDARVLREGELAARAGAHLFCPRA